MGCSPAPQQCALDGQFRELDDGRLMILLSVAHGGVTLRTHDVEAPQAVFDVMAEGNGVQKRLRQRGQPCNPSARRNLQCAHMLQLAHD